MDTNLGRGEDDVKHVLCRKGEGLSYRIAQVIRSPVLDRLDVS